MTHPDNLRHHGDEVMVFDAKGNYEFRGRIVGVHRCQPPIYDVQARGDASLRGRVCGIPDDRLRGAGKPYLAYERKSVEPKHIRDEV